VLCCCVTGVELVGLPLSQRKFNGALKAFAQLEAQEIVDRAIARGELQGGPDLGSSFVGYTVATMEEVPGAQSEAHRLLRNAFYFLQRPDDLLPALTDKVTEELGHYIQAFATSGAAVTPEALAQFKASRPQTQTQTHPDTQASLFFPLPPSCDPAAIAAEAFKSSTNPATGHFVNQLLATVGHLAQLPVSEVFAPRSDSASSAWHATDALESKFAPVASIDPNRGEDSALSSGQAIQELIRHLHTHTLPDPLLHSIALASAPHVTSSTLSSKIVRFVPTNPTPNKSINQ